MTRTVTFVLTGGALALACSSETFTSANKDAITDGGSGGGSLNNGGSTSSGGSRASGGRLSSGGARSSGGANGTGARSTGGNVGSTGGASGAGGIANSDSGVINSDGGVVSPDAGGVRCTGTDPTFPTFDKGCTTDTNCALVRHTTSCCGSQLFMGINHGEVARFQAAESICDAQYPACGCASQGADAEDGTLVPWGKESLIVVSCDNGVCQSHYGGKTFPCGTSTCTDLEYCSTFTGGPAGSPTSYSCTDLGGCTSCSCIGAATFCVCDESQGFIKVSCAAP